MIQKFTAIEKFLYTKQNWIKMRIDLSFFYHPILHHIFPTNWFCCKYLGLNFITGVYLKKWKLWKTIAWLGTNNQRLNAVPKTRTIRIIFRKTSNEKQLSSAGRYFWTPSATWKEFAKYKKIWQIKLKMSIFHLYWISITNFKIWFFKATVTLVVR